MYSYDFVGYVYLSNHKNNERNIAFRTINSACDVHFDSKKTSREKENIFVFNKVAIIPTFLIENEQWHRNY